MTLVRFEPTREFDLLSNQIEKFFNNTQSAFTQNPVVPKVNIYETKDSLVVELEAAGVKKDNIKIVLEDNILSIKGEKKYEENKDIVKRFRNERSFGEFKRSFTLPVDVNPDEVNAKFENGVLTITLTKMNLEKVNEKTIELK